MSLEDSVLGRGTGALCKKLANEKVHEELY